MHESDTNDGRRTTQSEALNTRRAKLESLARADPAAVSEDRKLLREAEQVGHVGSYSRDLRTGAIRWSDETYRIFGHEPREISPTFDFVVSHVHPEDREKFIKANRAVTEENKPYDVQYRIVCKDGSIRAVHSRASVERDPAGRPVRMFGAIQDITERKRMEEELRVLSGRHAAILAEVPDIIAEVDANKVYTWVNQAGLEFFGPEVLGKEAAFYFEGEQDTYKTVQPLFNGNPRMFYLESWQRRCDGEKRLLAWRCRSLVDATGNVTGALSTARDITEQRRSQEKLRESEERYRSLFENMLNGLAFCRMISEPGRPPDFVYLVVNQAFETLTGLKNVEGRRVSEVIPGIQETDPDLLEIYGRVARTGTPETFETYVQALNKWFAVSAYSSGRDHFVAVFDVITERKRAEQTLRERNRYIETILENAPIGFAVNTIHDGKVVFVGSKFEDIYGVPRGSLHSVEGFFEKTYLDPVFREQIRQRVLTDMATGDTARMRWEDLPITTAAGEKKFITATNIPLLDQDLMVSTVQDVTERKRAEEKLRGYQRLLRTLASELSLAEERERRRIAMTLHDHTCQSLVLARMKLEELLEAMSIGQAAAFHGVCRVLSDTIEDVRELTFDLSSPTLYRFGLEAALKELLEDKFGAERGVEYDFSDDHEPKPLTENVRVLLFQSVREVLVNILKHAGAHKVTLDIRRTDGSIRIAVTDDGVGFDVDEVSSLPARHRGFGLFSIQERLDCIGGVLEIDSRRGVGSRFTLVAPLKMESDDSGRKHDVDQNSARG